MVRKTVTIELETGLGARPVAMLVQVAATFMWNATQRGSMQKASWV